MLREQGLIVGTGCDIHKSVNFGSEPFLITIGNNTCITKGVELITHDGCVWMLRKCGLVSSKAVLYGRIKIGSNCNTVWNTIILPNVSIGDDVIIGAGSILTKNVPDNSVAAGVLGRVIKTIKEYTEKNRDSFVDAFGLTQ